MTPPASLSQRLAYSLVLGVWLCQLMLPTWASAETQPDWLEPTNPWLHYAIPESERDSFFQLYDQQIRVPESGPIEQVYGFVVDVLSEEGAQDYRRIVLEYQSDFETLEMLNLELLRNTERRDMLTLAEFSHDSQDAPSPHESTVSQLIIDIPELQSGDRLYYRYRLTGTNPQWAPWFSYTTHTRWGVAVGHHRFRLFWAREEPIFRHEIGPPTPFERIEKGAERHFKLDEYDLPAFESYDDAPDWVAQRSQVHFSNMPDWAALQDWLAPRASLAAQANPEQQQFAKRIAARHTSQKQRIMAGLQDLHARFDTQSAPLFDSSHAVRNSETIWAADWLSPFEYTAVLHGLFRSLGIQSDIALVNRQRQHTLTQYGPSPTAVDHALLKLQLNDEVFWLDPQHALHGEAERFEELEFADAGIALMLEGSSDMVDIQAPPGALRQTVEEHYLIRKAVRANTEMRVTTRHSEHSAAQLRTRLAEASLQTLQQDYLSFYSDFYPGIRSARSLDVTREDDGDIEITEYYEVEDLWTAVDTEGRFETDFYFTSLLSYLQDPGAEERNVPLSIPHPIDITHIITLEFEAGGWQFDDDDALIETPWFRMEVEHRFDPEQRVLTLSTHYQSLQDVVPVDGLARYREAHQDAVSWLSYGLYKNQPEAFAALTTTSDADPIDEELHQLMIVLAVLAVLTLVSFILWAFETPAHDAEQFFYHVSPKRFLLLNLITLNLYSAYWFFRNWKHLRHRRADKLMPFWRAVFSVFWFIPFGYALRKEQRLDAQKVILPLSIVWGLGLLYIALSCIANAEFNVKLTTLSLLIPFVVLPYLSTIRRAFPEGAEVTHGHIFRWRNAFFAPLSLFYLAYMLNNFLLITPSAFVVKGSSLPAMQKQFLEAQVLPTLVESSAAPHNIEQFYSAAYFDWRLDGNGFTDNQLFTYWMEGEELYTDSMAFTDIQSLELQFDEDRSSYYIEAQADSGEALVLYAPDDKPHANAFFRAMKQQWQSPATEREDSSSH